MKKRVFGIATAVILALVGTGLLIAYVKGAEDRALEGQEVVEVLVVGNTIPEGSSADEIGEDDVQVELVPRKVAVDGAITSLDDVEGLYAAHDLLPGEQLTGNRFVQRTSTSNYARTVPAPDGLLEVTVSLEPERVVGGSIAPGDTVAVVASFESFKISSLVLPENFDTSLTKTELDELEKIFFLDDKLLTGEDTPNSTHIIEHKVFVTHVQEEEAPQNTFNDDDTLDSTALAPTGNLLVTLAIDAPGVERLVFTQEFGSIWLAAETDDVSEDGTKIVTRGNVYTEVPR